MSSQSGVVVVGGGVVLVAGSAFIAARAVTSMAGCALIALGDAADRAVTRRQAELHELGRWEGAAQEVIGRNARLRYAAHRAAGDPTILRALPAPCDVSCLSIEELQAWSVSADEALAHAEAQLAERTGRRMQALVSDVLASAVPGPEHPGAHRSQDRARATRETEQAAVERVLEVLLPQATEDEVDAVGRAAAEIVADTDTEWSVRLRTLRRRVARVNDVVRARQADALEAAFFLEALDGDPESGPILPRLRAVMDGAALDDDLRRSATAGAVRVRERHERAYVQTRVVSALEEMGYVVDEDFATLHAEQGRLRVARDGWSEHAVGLNLDERGLRSQLVRTQERNGADATAVDVEREQEWCSSVGRLADVLGAQGIETEARGLVEPGLTSVPVVAAPRRAGNRVGELRRDIR